MEKTEISSKNKSSSIQIGLWKNVKKIREMGMALREGGNPRDGGRGKFRNKNIMASQNEFM